jgi:electron transport complex protein RnfB
MSRPSPTLAAFLSGIAGFSMLDIIIPSIASVASITILGAVFGLALTYAKIRLHVERDERYGLLLEALPNANCGACGQPGCSGYALKILEGAPVNLCMIGGREVVEKLARIMGVEAQAREPKKARVRCQGGADVTRKRFLYTGPKSCAASQQIMEGFKVCRWGCLGLGDCERVCPFDAIRMSDGGLPEVDWEKCTGCGNCVSACPRGIISLEEEGFDVHMLCLNREKAPVMKQGCSVGCIACNRCVKACKEVFAGNPDIETAIEVVDFCAVIDYATCINCGKCAEVCPQKVIEFRKVPALAG